MSKFLFWSPYHGLGQTSNEHVTALILNLFYKKDILLMQTHFKNNNLESPLVGYNVENQSSNNEIFEGIGLDMAVTYSNMNHLNKETLRSCCLTPAPSIFLLPGTETKNKESYDRDIGGSVGYVIKDSNELVDYVLIDTNSGNDALSLKLMDMADLIIINLTQRRYVIEKFFNEYGDIFRDRTNVFYLFGDYDDNSSYNINNFRKKYSKHINGNNSGVIPYCTKYMDAINESNVIQFMQKGLKRYHKKGAEKLLSKIGIDLYATKYGKDETDYFFHRSILSTEKMLKMLHKPLNRYHMEGKK